MTADGPLERLGSWAAALTYPEIPEPVAVRARLALRDTVGTMIGGWRTTAGRTAVRAAQRGGPGDALIPALPIAVRASPVLATFAAAVNASALDFDDGHYAGGAIHPSSVVVPSLLVAAQRLERVDGASFTRAQVIGYEIGLRAAHLLWPKHADDDYHCTGTAGSIGAAAAVAALRGGDADTIARSIAIAWAHAPMSTFQLPMVKESIGWAGATALFAADLADAGFMSAPGRRQTPIDATFPPTPFHRSGAMDDRFVASLGTAWETAQIYTKPYAACRYTHTALRSLRDMLDDGLRAEHVHSIVVFTPRPSMNLTDRAPATLDDAQYSFPFVLASMALSGAADATQINDATLADEARLAFARRVEVRYDPSLDATYPQHYATRLVATTFDGTVLERLRMVAPGDPAEPMSEAELRSKFVALAAPTTGEPWAIDASTSLVSPRLDDVCAAVAPPA